MAKSTEFPQYTFVTPKSYTSGRKTGQPTVVFIHTTEGSEGRQSAEDGAAYDARRTDGTSTHFFCDQDTTIQCVSTWNEAHAARTHGNDVGLHFELCGKAGQDAKQWADAASLGTIEQAARLAVAIRTKYGKARFPLVNLTPAQLRAGAHGFAEHEDATRAWPEDGGTHTDPGPNFPWTKFFNRIIELEAAMATVDLANSTANKDVFEDQLLTPAFFDKDGSTTKVNFKEIARLATVAKTRVTELSTGAAAGAIPAHMNGDGRSVWTRLDDLEQMVTFIKTTVEAIAVKLDVPPGV